MRDKIGVDPADETLATDADGNNILENGAGVPL